MSEDITSKESVPRKTKAKKQPAIDTRTEAEKEIDAVIAGSRIKGQSDKKRKKTFFRGLMGGGAMLLGYGIYSLFATLDGSMAYGICKTFLELSVRYPNTLYLSTVEEFSSSVRIWYVHTDSFGEYRLEPIQCYFKPDPTGTVPYLLEKILVNRRELDSRQVEDFNRVVPIIFANPPNLDLPWKLPDNLSDLKVETEKYRKPILGAPH